MCPHCFGNNSRVQVTYWPSNSSKVLIFTLQMVQTVCFHLTHRKSEASEGMWQINYKLPACPARPALPNPFIPSSVQRPVAPENVLGLWGRFLMKKTRLHGADEAKLKVLVVNCRQLEHRKPPSPDSGNHDDGRGCLPTCSWMLTGVA